MDEIFDVVNENDEVIGSASRSDCHKKNLRHRASHILIFDKLFCVLMQKRSNTITYPSMWTSSVSGHVDRGESYEQAALRESREEIGVELQKISELFTLYNESDNEQEFVRVFASLNEGPFKIDKNEVAEVKFVDLSQVEALNLTPKAKVVFAQLRIELAKNPKLLHSL